MKRTLSLYILLGFASLVVTLGTAPTLAAGSDAAASPTEINIDNFSFSPAVATVKAGTTVTWTNRDDIPHTIVADDKSFKSKVLDTGEKFTFTPTKPGTYSYFCSIHPKMTAKLVVQ
jgi:plastocyanin